jgi:signal transduction histidine kinase
MTADEKSKLFQLPDKPRDPTEVGKKGAGFGLVLSQMLAKRMGGELNVVSSSDAGSIFRLIIPLQWLPEENSDPLEPTQGFQHANISTP